MIPAIQPVTVMGTSQTTFPLLAPAQTFCAAVGASAGNYGQLSVYSKAQGGTFLDTVEIFATAPIAIEFKVVDADPGYAGAVTGNVIYGSPVSEFASAAAGALAVPVLCMWGHSKIPLYIPNGKWGVIMALAVNTTVFISGLARDVPAGEGGA